MIVNIFRVASLLIALGFLAACAGEVGGEGPEGPEGSSEIGGEGPEGPEGGATGGNEPFVSTGMSRGAHQSISLAPDETFAGLLYDIEVAVYYNPVLESFVGRIRNEATEAVCDVRVIVTLDGYRSVNASFSGQPFVLDGLAQFGGTEFEFPAPGETFSTWTVGAETATCSSAPGPVAGGGEGGEGGEGSGSGEGGEGGEGSGSGEHGGSGGGEGSGEHGGSGGEGSGGGEHGGSGEGSGEGPEGGSESGDEASPPIPINQPFSGTFGSQRFSFAYDAIGGAFRGAVENPTAAFVCESRTEIHLGSGGRVVELGPTMPVNVPPGGALKVVMSAQGYVLDMYTLHPESTPCP